MKELEVGDKMYNVRQEGFTDFSRYTFSEVIELTKTLAVLKNGVRLANRPRPSFIEEYGYAVSKRKSTHWHLVSLQAIRQAQIESQKITAFDWFEEKVFTLKEKQFIYNQFKKIEADQTDISTESRLEVVSRFNQ